MECKKEMGKLITLCINRISFVLIVCLLITMMSACEMPNVDVASSQEKERMEVDLIELSDEHKKTTILNYDEFYQKYENKILVISGTVSGNYLNQNSGKYIVLGNDPYSEEYVKQHNYNVPSGEVALSFQEENLTDQVKNLIQGDQITVEGTLSPEWDISPVLENCKLTSFSAYVDPKKITFDIDALLSNTKPDISNPTKYPFVKEVSLTFDPSVSTSNQSIILDAEVAEGTDPDAVLDYAYTVIEALNNHAHELDNSIALSSDTSYGGLYKRTFLMLHIYYVKHGFKEYYLFDAVSDRRAKLKLEKAFR